MQVLFTFLQKSLVFGVFGINVSYNVKKYQKNFSNWFTFCKNWKLSNSWWHFNVKYYPEEVEFTTKIPCHITVLTSELWNLPFWKNFIISGELTKDTSISRFHWLYFFSTKHMWVYYCGHSTRNYFEHDQGYCWRLNRLFQWAVISLKTTTF